MYKILIVEDDKVIASQISKHLSKWGYVTSSIEDFNTILDTFLSFEPQLVLMDITLPFYNGYYWCSAIRKISKVPILFLSSNSDHMNIIMALNMGGDDFISKPFDLEILCVKVQALLRRSYDYFEQTSLLEHNGVIFNISEATLSYQNNKIELTKNEYKIIQLLYNNMGHVVSRELMMQHLWDNECFIDDNTLTVNINRLRRKLEDISINHLIKTKKGIGYIIGD